MNEQWFWERCGGIHVDYNDKDGCPAHYRMLDGGCFLGTAKPNLKNLFKYAVPLLERKLGYKEAYMLLIRWITEVVNEKDPADSLFGAIYEAFGGK